MLASPSLYPRCPSPPRHLQSIAVGQGGLWASTWVLLACKAGPFTNAGGGTFAEQQKDPGTRQLQRQR